MMSFTNEKSCKRSFYDEDSEEMEISMKCDNNSDSSIINSENLRENAINLKRKQHEPIFNDRRKLIKRTESSPQSKAIEQLAQSKCSDCETKKNCRKLYYKNYYIMRRREKPQKTDDEKKARKKHNNANYYRSKVAQFRKNFKKVAELTLGDTLNSTNSLNEKEIAKLTPMVNMVNSTDPLNEKVVESTTDMLNSSDSVKSGRPTQKGQKACGKSYKLKVMKNKATVKRCGKVIKNKNALGAGVFRTKDKRHIAQKYKEFLLTKLTQSLLNSMPIQDRNNSNLKLANDKLKCQLLAGKALYVKRKLFARSQVHADNFVEMCKTASKRIKTDQNIDAKDLKEIFETEQWHCSTTEPYHYDTCYFYLGNRGNLRNDAGVVSKIVRADEYWNITDVLRDCEVLYGETLIFDINRNPFHLERYEQMGIVLQVNEKGLVTNLFEMVKPPKKKKDDIKVDEDGKIIERKDPVYWSCGKLCNVRPATVLKVTNFVVEVSKIISKNSLMEIFGSEFDLCDCKGQFCHQGLKKPDSKNKDADTEVNKDDGINEK